MESVPRPGAAVPDSPVPLNRWDGFLRGDCGEVELRVTDGMFVEDGLPSESLRRIERDEERRGFRDSLQCIHPVGNRRFWLAHVGACPVDPARPAGLSPRHLARIAMQDGAVASKADRSENSSLDGIGIAQKCERRVGVAGHDNVVESLRSAPGSMQVDTIRVANDSRNR